MRIVNEKYEKTKEEQFFKKFLNLENKLVENYRQIMYSYIVENMRLINDKKLKKNEKILNFLIDSLIVSGPDP